MSESVYASNWNPHLYDRKMSRAFWFFLKQTQTENELSAFGLVQLSFATLTRVSRTVDRKKSKIVNLIARNEIFQVIKASFSYVAFLQNVTN